MEGFFEIFVPTNYQRLGIDFFQAYEIEDAIVCPDQKMKGLIPKTKRVCRFCKLKNGEVSFRKEAHLISKLLGNKYLVSDFECDNCNEIFGDYENHLSNFLGPNRAFYKLLGIGQNYKFKSPNKKTVAEDFKLYGLENSFSISREDIQDQTFEFNREAGETIIRFTKHSYSPLLLYKSILKIALSCLKIQDVADYELAFKYVRSNKLNNNFKGFSNLLVFSTPPGTGHKTPFAYLYKKRDKVRNTCSHVFVLHFMNQIFQIVIPLNKNDLKFFNNEPIPVFYCPPMFHDLETADSILIRDQLLDLSSEEMVKNEEEVIGFRYDTNEYNKGVSYDLETNEIKKGTFDPNSVKQIVIMPKDSFLDLPVNKQKNQ